MCSIILAATHSHPAIHELVQLVRDELGRAGEEDVRLFELPACARGHCQGELDCDRTTVDRCEGDATERPILDAIHDAHNLLLVDEVTFGGHGAAMKDALDRLLCRLLPSLERRVTVTRRGLRYERPFALFALGFAAVRNASMAATFRGLAVANALNFVAPHVGSDVFVASDRARWPAQLSHALDGAHAPSDAVRDRADLRSALVQLARADARAALPAPRRAALLVGSARHPHGGVSECLANASAERLRAAGLDVRMYRASALMDAAAESALRELAAADLVQLVTPLYVDALPGTATRVLERVAELRAHDVPPARFTMVVQSGAPEPEQNRHALAIARHFAALAGYHWSGALVLGGASQLDGQRRLDAQHGPAEHVRLGLDLACAALARGGVVEGPAIQAMLRASSPGGLARGSGCVGYRLAAYQRAQHEPGVGTRGAGGAARGGAKRARANA